MEITPHHFKAQTGFPARLYTYTDSIFPGVGRRVPGMGQYPALRRSRRQPGPACNRFDRWPAILGPSNAPVTIVEFSDYQCPYCQAWDQQVYQQLMTSYPNKIRFVYRDLPLPMHPEAIPAAEAADCAGEQGAYWKYHDALFNQQYGLNRAAYEHYAADLGLDGKAFAACLDSQRYLSKVQANASDAASAGLNSTPSFVINGRVLIGALPFADFKAVIDEELAAKP